MGVVNVDINGTLEEARETLITDESCFVRDLRFLFLTKGLKMINPKVESDLILKTTQKKCIIIKVMEPAGKLTLSVWRVPA